MAYEIVMSGGTWMSRWDIGSSIREGDGLKWDTLMDWHRELHRRWERKNNRIVSSFRSVVVELENHLNTMLFGKRKHVKIEIGGSRVNDLYNHSSDLDCKVILAKGCDSDIRDDIIRFFSRNYKFKYPAHKKYTNIWHLRLLTLDELEFHEIRIDVNFALMSSSFYGWASKKWHNLIKFQFFKSDEDKILYCMNRNYFKLNDLDSSFEGMKRFSHFSAQTTRPHRLWGDCEYLSQLIDMY